VVAASFGLLLLARSLHGLFLGVAFAVGAGMMPPEKMSKAISFVFGGTAVATALGVPLGTLIGQGLGWRAGATIIAGGIVLVPAPGRVDVLRLEPGGRRGGRLPRAGPRTGGDFGALNGWFSGITTARGR
jgi:MFS transporter, DHA1 family, inner membrane transport protein